MNKFILLSRPWWVNLLIVVPLAAYIIWNRRLVIAKQTLFVSAFFGAAFGFVEASVVVYLRGAAGLLSNCVSRLPSDIMSFGRFNQSHLASQLPKDFLMIEVVREIATIVMLISVALLAVSGKRERWAIFIWIFALWDIFYYVGLKLTIGWPQFWTTSDVLFLIPVPWLSQVWFPILVSTLGVLAVILSLKWKRGSKS